MLDLALIGAKSRNKYVNDYKRLIPAPNSPTSNFGIRLKMKLVLYFVCFGKIRE